MLASASRPFSSVFVFRTLQAPVGGLEYLFDTRVGTSRQLLLCDEGEGLAVLSPRMLLRLSTRRPPFVHAYHGALRVARGRVISDLRHPELEPHHTDRDLQNLLLVRVERVYNVAVLWQIFRDVPPRLSALERCVLSGLHNPPRISQSPLPRLPLGDEGPSLDELLAKLGSRKRRSDDGCTGGTADVRNYCRHDAHTGMSHADAHVENEAGVAELPHALRIHVRLLVVVKEFPQAL